MTTPMKPVTLLTLKALKERGQKAVYLTAYDYPLALLADRAGVDMILVGDSLAMTTLGYRTTHPVTMDEMISHAKAVMRGVKRVFVLGDMPFLSYQPSDRDAIINAGRFVQEAGCHAVKLEGGRRTASRIKAIVDAGIVVQGHLGLTPQNLAQIGGYRVQGKTVEGYRALLDDALAIEDAGASSLLLEAMPPVTATAIRQRVTIPVYGIGAGPEMDGQLVTIHDAIGLFEEFTPKFVKRYCEAGAMIEQAMAAYCEDVRSGRFPATEHQYELPQDEMGRILAEGGASGTPQRVRRQFAQ